MADKLDIVRIDVLLWALGGFDTAEHDAPYLRSYPDWVSRRVLEIARRPKASYGEIRDLAASCDRSTLALSTVIKRARHGNVPVYRRAENLLP